MAASATIEVRTRSAFSAVIAFCDVVAVGVIKALAEAGVTVPRDVSVVGFDNIELSQYLPVSLTTLDTRKKDLARYSISTLLAQLQGDGARKGGDRVTKRLKPKLVIRESTGPPSGRRG